MHHASANGLTEALNKTLCNLLKKVIGRTKRDWHERISEALWAYRTTHRTPTQGTPYSLVYGVEVVPRLDSQIPSLRIAIQEGLTTKRMQSYAFKSWKRWMREVSKLSNIWSVIKPIITTHKTKSTITSKWDGLYVIQEVYTNGVYLIMAEDVLKIGLINGKFLKHYYL
ncbi:hypothetical protein ACFX2B_007168 [Malus domestica]